MPEALPAIDGVLIIPRLRVQNANAISSPMTWGFPAISAFLGTMHALERQLPSHLPLGFEGVGVICHDFEAQASRAGRVNTFHLTRNPINHKGETTAIVEEGRAQLDITLVFGVTGAADAEDPETVAAQIAEMVAGMRVAGGSVMPRDRPVSRKHRPALVRFKEDDEQRAKQMQSWHRRLLPGFALVCRDDLLNDRLAELQREDESASALDAWLDLSALNFEPISDDVGEEAAPPTGRKSNWRIRRPPGWIVPIPVGYGALSPVHENAAVHRTRDDKTPFRFVESLYSIGEWISPHRLRRPEEFLWYTASDSDQGIYRCHNDYAAGSAQSSQH